MCGSQGGNPSGRKPARLRTFNSSFRNSTMDKLSRPSHGCCVSNPISACGRQKWGNQNGMPWYMESWTTCVPLVVNFRLYPFAWCQSIRLSRRINSSTSCRHCALPVPACIHQRGVGRNVIAAHQAAPHWWKWAKHRVPVPQNGLPWQMERTKTCGPILGRFILTHTHVPMDLTVAYGLAAWQHVEFEAPARHLGFAP